MRNKVIHIALFLLGIFVFPIVYQPVHIVWHHSPKTECGHECCHTTAEQPKGIVIDVVSSKDEICPVCEYHFPVNDLPQLFFYTSATGAITDIINKLDAKRAHKQVYSIKIPRAPPVLHS